MEYTDQHIAKTNDFKGEASKGRGNGSSFTLKGSINLGYGYFLLLFILLKEGGRSILTTLLTLERSNLTLKRSWYTGLRSQI